ncbi:MAG: Ig-like domain-containing protein [Clostridia bacterium]|nr:Ig-like domain-containing protein [Clostridia bacterium]
MEPGDVAEALTVTATPVRAAHADIVWSSNAEGVAKVDAKTGVITAVANGTATITATAGALTDTITVKVQEDKTQTWADLSEAYYTAGDNKNQKVTLNTDTATGLEYFSVNGSASVRVPNWCGTIEKGQMVGLTFLTRVTDAANNAGAVRAAVQLQGLVEGYVQPEFYARSTAMGGGWERVTFYAREEYVNSYPYFVFIYLADGTTAATPSYDVADVSIFLPEADDVNRFGAGADFEEGYAPVAMGTNTQTGLLTKADAAIVDDPTGADNKVFHISSASANGGAGDYWYAASLSYHNEAGVRQSTKVFESTKMYKISFRVYSASDVLIDSYGGASFKGTTGTKAKSGQWRTVTTYMYTTGSFSSAYALHVRFYNEAYIDDLEMYECVDATGFEVKGDKEMTIGESQTLEIVSVPKHSFPGTLTTTVSGTGLTLSGTTVTAAAVSGVEVKGGTVTVTSDLTDAETGNPITATLDIKVNYPEEHFVNGTMDTGSLDGLWFSTDKLSASDGAYAFGLDGVGINGTKGAAIYSTGAKYFKSQSFKLKPNSTYIFSTYARANGTGAALELNLVTGNNNSGNKVVTVAQAGYGDMRSKVDTEWTKFVMYIQTGATTTFMDSNWNLYFQMRSAPTGVADGETPAVFLDNISLQLISEGDNHYTGLPEAYGFEEGEHEYFTPYAFSKTDDMLAEGEGINGSTALKVPNDNKTTSYIIKNTPMLDSYAIYKLSFWTKADQQYIDEGGKMSLYWGSNNAGALYVQSQTNDGNFYATTEWKKNEFILVTDGKSNLNTNVFYFNTSNTTVGTGNIYFDDMKLECIAADNFLSAAQSSTSQELSADGGETWKSYLTNVEPGTKVLVKNWQYSGRVMVPGSLKVTTPDGTATKILNKDYDNGYTKENFGVGDGRIFEFIMPETSGRVTATFTNDADNTFNMDTVGTSLRYKDAENYDGIRFLTRLNVKADTLKVVDDELTITVKYGGVDYEVVEIGSWLKRYEENEGVEVELNAENALWTAVSYKKGETDMKLLDYTAQYIDFASVMLTEYEDRVYTARGYIVLEDAEGGQVTVAAGTQLSNSIASAAELL